VLKPSVPIPTVPSPIVPQANDLRSRSLNHNKKKIINNNNNSKSFCNETIFIENLIIKNEIF